jgi:hypothetical protein
MSGKTKKRNLALEKLATGSPISRRALIRSGAVLAGGAAAAALLSPSSATRLIADTTDYPRGSSGQLRDI